MYPNIGKMINPDKRLVPLFVPAKIKLSLREKKSLFRKKKKKKLKRKQIDLI